MSGGLLLAEELFLLSAYGPMRLRGIGAAVAAELILEQRAQVRRRMFLGFGTKRLVLTDQSGTGDDILDAAIAWTSGRRRPPLLPWAVGEFTELAYERCRQRLIERELIHAEEGPQVTDAVQQIRNRVVAVLLAGESAPDVRTLALASLAAGSRVSDYLVAPGDALRVRRNAKRLPERHREIAAFALDTQELAEHLHEQITDVGDAASAIVGGDGGGDGGGGNGSI